jgi:hypothetical protein
MRRCILLVMLGLLPGLGHAATPPLSPPCEGAPSPAYPPAGHRPAVGVWSESDLKRLSWHPPACLYWAPERTRLIAALAGQFRHAGAMDELVDRLVRISALKAVRYWSVTKKRWEPLVAEAGAVAGPEDEPQPDPVPATLTPGASFRYFEVGRSGRTIYRMTVHERSADRIVVATENVTPIRIIMLTAFEPGALQSVVFVERRGPDRWGYYQLVRATEGANAVALGKDASYLNRLGALFRHTAGIPTDREPPISR